MRTDLWVIWTCACIVVLGLGGKLGSRFFPSQARIDAADEAGYRDGRKDGWRARGKWEAERREQLPPQSPRGELPPAAEWNDTVENLRALAGPHYEPLARGAGDPPIAGYNSTSCSGDLVTKHHDPLKGDSPVPGSGLTDTPIHDWLAAEFAAHKPPGPATTAELTAPQQAPAGPGPDPLFDALDDTGAFALISFELKYLKVLAAEPFGLTPWRTR